MLISIINAISSELSIPTSSIGTVIDLLESNNTIPFIARYRKEKTGNLDEVQIKAIQERYNYLKELEDRKEAILKSIESQGKLTEDLKNQIVTCSSKTELEDLYLPYKPKRRTRAAIAREKDLEPLALWIWEQTNDKDVYAYAETFVNVEKGVEDAESALSGARDILAEKIAEDSEVRALIRHFFQKEGVVISKVDPKVKGPTKFEQYYDFKERVSTITSHRYLAIRRGEREEVLNFSIEIDAEPALKELHKLLKIKGATSSGKQLEIALEDAYKRLLLPSIETDIRVDLKLKSDQEAVDVFAENLRHLLLASPLGPKNVIGIDPGIRTGCKCVSVDSTGKFIDNVTIYPFQGEKGAADSEKILLALIKKHQPFAIGIGNGTAGRETEAFVRKTLSQNGLNNIIVIQVNEAGASVYSASDIAREEFPDLDLTIRGAISIARRLQDPLAELVKIDPKSIGVGQYQHDVHQPMLQDKLSFVVESCVNHVGVELNTASASLLSYVAGIGQSLSQKIVKHRDTHGPFLSREDLMEVSGFGPRAFEQATGFLRIRNGKNPLDATAVHPERYELVMQMAKDLNEPIEKLITNTLSIDKINISKYADQTVGELTLKDIIAELKKPGRDPRSQFEPPRFREDVMSLEDLKQGMKLQGVVTNVTAFGAFVDIGVHQDGLIHLSELSDKFIKHPSEVVKAGDKIDVEVLQVDKERKRISLTAKKQKGVQPFKQVKKDFNTNPFAGL